MVLDGHLVGAGLDADYDEQFLPAFTAALAVTRQPRASMLALYQGWIDTLVALRAARLTGAFRPPAGAEHAAARREAFREIGRLETEIARLRTTAAKERQMARQVEVNLALKRLEARLAELTAGL